MSARQAKKIIYGAFYLIILAAIAFGIYSLVKPAPKPVVVCDPNSGIGCAAAGATPIQVSDVWTFMTSPGHYTFLAEIANVNATSAAENFSYTFTVSDSSGVSQSFAGQSFIYANEVKYVVLPNEEVTVPVNNVDFSIDATDTVWVNSEVMGLVPQFSFTNVEGSVGSTTVAVGGAIKNNDIASFNTVSVVAIFKDTTGSPIGASYTQLNNFTTNSSQDFSVIFPKVPGIDPNNSKIFAYALRR